MRPIFRLPEAARARGEICRDRLHIPQPAPFFVQNRRRPNAQSARQAQRKGLQVERSLQEKILSQRLPILARDRVGLKDAGAPPFSLAGLSSRAFA